MITRIETTPFGSGDTTVPMITIYKYDGTMERFVVQNASFPKETAMMIAADAVHDMMDEYSIRLKQLGFQFAGVEKPSKAG